MDGVHDMGGMHGFGPVLTPGSGDTHHEPWELRAQVLGLLSGSVSRGAIEGLGPSRYLGASYYERWLLTAEDALVAQGRLDRADLDRWYAALEADRSALPTASAPELVEVVRAGLRQPPHFEAATSPRFSVGGRVRVRRMRPEHHHRCPRYVRGAAGTVEGVCGLDHVPDSDPSDNEVEPVYTVRFSSVDLWGPTGRADEAPFTLLIDLWERYLEVA